MARHAGQAVGVHQGAVDFGVGRQPAAKDSDRVVATVAVAREGNAARLVANEDIDTCAIKRRTE